MKSERVYKKGLSVSPVLRGSFRALFSFETVFILFLFAGRYKGAPYLAWVPIDITALLGVLSVLVGVWVVARRGFALYRPSIRLVGLAIALVVFVIFSLVWTPGHVYAREKVFNIALVLWSLIGAAIVIAPDVRRVKRFIVVLFVFALCVVMLSGCTVLFNSSSAWFGVDIENVWGDSYQGVGLMAQFAAIIAYTYSLFERKELQRLVLTIVFFGLLAFLLVVGCRGTLILTVVTIAGVPLLLTTHFIGRKVFIRKRFLVRPVCMVVGLMLMIFLLINAGAQLPTVDRLRVLLDPSGGSSVAVRIQYQKAAFNMWLGSPLWGNGVGSFSLLLGHGDTAGGPHNLILDLLNDVGLIGLLLFVMVAAYALRLLGPIRSASSSRLHAVILLLFISVMVADLTFMGELSGERDLFAFLGLMAFSPIALAENSRRSLA